MSDKRVLGFVGVAGALVWIYTRNQERDKLEKLLNADLKLKLIRDNVGSISIEASIAPLTCDGIKVSDVAGCQKVTREYVEDQIRYTNFVTADEVYAALQKDMTRLINREFKPGTGAGLQLRQGYLR